MRALVIMCVLTLACTSAALANGAHATEQTTQPSVQQQVPVQVPESQPTNVGAGPTATCPATTINPTDQMMDMCLISSCNITNQQLVRMRSLGLTNTDIATACAISSRANIPVNTLVTDFLQNCNKDWNAVAAKYNVNLSSLPNATMLSSANSDAFNTAFLSQYYGISQNDVMSLRQQGFSWPEINMMANAAVISKNSIQQIAALRSQGMSWNDIAARYNIAACDLLRPVPGRVVAAAPFCCGAGPNVAPANIYDKDGNVLLTADQANMLYMSGYDWIDVAVAANIARETGWPINNVLQQLRTGTTWPQIAMDYGVPPDVAFNICGYPFCKRSIYPSSVEEANLRETQRYYNCNPCPAPCPEPCPAPCPAPNQVTCPAPCPTTSTCPAPCPTPSAVPCPAPCPEQCPAPATTPCPTPCPAPACPS